MVFKQFTNFHILRIGLLEFVYRSEGRYFEDDHTYYRIVAMYIHDESSVSSNFLRYTVLHNNRHISLPETMSISSYSRCSLFVPSFLP